MTPDAGERAELNLHFPDKNNVVVSFGPKDNGSPRLPFVNPIVEKNLRDLQWYVETYAAHSLGDPDDAEAKRIAEQLPVFGKALFDASFGELQAQHRLHSFRSSKANKHLLTISAEHPAILTLPWELLHDSASGGKFLFMDTSPITIRRHVAAAVGERPKLGNAEKDRLHLLLVVSRPDDASFLDPRSDTLAVLDAIDQHAAGRITCEFLRPATLDALLGRLQDSSRPPIDIVHFDGHGVFDHFGGLPERVRRPTQDSPVNTGYLLFQNPNGRTHFVSADQLGANLKRHNLALVILSACQSAAVGTENNDQEVGPMASIAAGLAAFGILAVLAMTYSVLVATTRSLFGELYKGLARHLGVGEALDNARRQLADHPEKYEVQRGPNSVPLKVYDWFVPALYQTGATERVLSKLKVGNERPKHAQPHTNLANAPATGFVGRRRDLWNIESWFAAQTRRVTITGFGGQGKTALAQEAGRWLVRTEMFQAAVFVDYSRVQGRDALAIAVANIASVLGHSLPDAKAAGEALKQTRVLVILDNLETVALDSLAELLGMAACWSEVDGSRVLCTSRQPDFGHPKYPIEGRYDHRRIVLGGLGGREMPEDALEWFAALLKLPPEPTVQLPSREALIELFELVKFHPLSIRVLAEQLKSRAPAELGERLEQLLTVPRPSDIFFEKNEDAPLSLVASLELSLDKLANDARDVLPALGVFQGGAFEDNILAVSGLGESGERERLEALRATAQRASQELSDYNRDSCIGTPNLREVLGAAGVFSDELTASEIPAGVLDLAPGVLDTISAYVQLQLAELQRPAVHLWPKLRRHLEAAALIEAESVPGMDVPFLRFHPTLTPMLWARLSEEDRARLTYAHVRRYYAVSNGLLREARTRDPYLAQAIAWRELPNLVQATHAALTARHPNAATLSDVVNSFLVEFGLNKEADMLADAGYGPTGEVGSRAWYLAQADEFAQGFATASGPGIPEFLGRPRAVTASRERVGSRTWYLAQANKGDQLARAGRVSEAAKLFQTILEQIGVTPSRERVQTLTKLCRCFRRAGHLRLAEQHGREALALIYSLDQIDEAQALRENCLTQLAYTLEERGMYVEAEQCRKAAEADRHGAL